MENRDTETLDLIKTASAFIRPLKIEIAKIISGQEELIDRLIIGLITSGHLLVEGVPGLAKTLTINTLAQAIDADASRLQFTPDLLPADIIACASFFLVCESFCTLLARVCFCHAIYIIYTALNSCAVCLLFTVC